MTVFLESSSLRINHHINFKKWISELNLPWAQCLQAKFGNNHLLYICSYNILNLLEMQLIIPFLLINVRINIENIDIIVN